MGLRDVVHACHGVAEGTAGRAVCYSKRCIHRKNMLHVIKGAGEGRGM